jgi:hypothetical protein
LIEVRGDLGSDGLPATAFDEACRVQAVQSIGDVELRLLLGAERLPKLLLGERSLAVTGPYQQGFQHGFVVVALLR